VGLIAGLVAGLFAASRSNANAALFFGVGTGAGCVLGVALAVVVVVAVTNGPQTQPYSAPPAPGEGIRRSRQNAMTTGPVAGLVTLLGAFLLTLLSLMLLFVAYAMPDSQVAAAILALLILGLSTGLYAGVIAGAGIGLAVALGRRWYVRLGIGLVVVLAIALGSLLALALLAGTVGALQRGGGAYLRHRALRRQLVRNGAIPKDYLAFLQFAERNVLLRRQGGGYQFLHPMMLDHLADSAHDIGQHYPPEEQARGAAGTMP
jgi:hypothetical protein